MRICAYIAGDKNIIYPSIVCLSSVKKYNQDIDLFMFTESKFANEEQLRLCKKYDIEIVDVNLLNDNDFIEGFSSFGEKERWPVHVFYNYKAPDFLYNLGYDYAIKVDYDMLCVGSFDMNEILPSREEGICVCHKNNILSYIDEEGERKLKERFCIDNYNTANVGIIIFDLRYVKKYSIDKVYKNVYCFVRSNKIAIIGELCEQFCFGLLQSALGISFKKLDFIYNFKPYYEWRSCNNVKIIHYNGLVEKPWQDISISKMEMSKKQFFRYMAMVSCWVDYTNSLDFREKWYRNQDFSFKNIYNIFIEYMKCFDAEERRELLESYMFFLKSGDIIKGDIVYDKSYRYVQMRMFSDSSVHYELLFRQNKISVCIHFEGEWRSCGDYLKNVIRKQIKLDMLSSESSAEIYIVINTPKNISLVCSTVKTVIEQSYDGICMFLNMYKIHKEVARQAQNEMFSSIARISQYVREVDEKLKYIYEATVGDKKDNSNFIFETVYRQKIWGGTSGSGSNPAVLQGYIHFLNDFIKNNHIKSISDIGCGDWQYMQLINLNGIDYTGYDVAASVIETNCKKFSSKNIEFVLYDGDFSTVKSSDLAICKDVLQHLPNKNIFQFIENIKRFKYVLIANDIEERMTCNRDIPMGQCRPLDLRLPPFNIKAEVAYTIDRSHLKKRNIMVLLIENEI